LIAGSCTSKGDNEKKGDISYISYGIMFNSFKELVLPRVDGHNKKGIISRLEEENRKKKKKGAKLWSGSKS
jgi:hypothetical protein